MTGIAQRIHPSVQVGLTLAQEKRLIRDQRFAKQVNRDAVAEIERLDRERMELLNRADVLAVEAQRLRKISGRSARTAAAENRIESSKSGMTEVLAKGQDMLVAEKRSVGNRKFKSFGEQDKYLRGVESSKVAPQCDIARRERGKLDKKRRRIRKRVPSEPWLDAHWENGEPFPPPWDHPRKSPLVEPPASAMKTCNICGRETPPQCVGSSGGCDDCRLAAMNPWRVAKLPGSSCKISLAALKSNARAGRQYHGGF